VPASGGIEVMRKVKGIYWGWHAVTGAFIALFITYGARYSFGVFVKPMFVEYAWPMAIISIAASINLLAAFLILLLKTAHTIPVDRAGWSRP
jgi:hypothetical protein